MTVVQVSVRELERLKVMVELGDGHPFAVLFQHR